MADTPAPEFLRFVAEERRANRMFSRSFRPSNRGSICSRYVSTRFATASHGVPSSKRNRTPSIRPGLAADASSRVDGCCRQ